MKRIALVGREWSGVTHIAHALAEEHMFVHISMSDYLMRQYARDHFCTYEYVAEQKEHLRTPLAEYASKLGMDMSVEAFKPFIPVDQSCVIEKVRTNAQARQLQFLGFTVIKIIERTDMRLLRSPYYDIHGLVFFDKMQDELCPCCVNFDVLRGENVEKDIERILLLAKEQEHE